ncbi:MAG: hypothetical protein DWQ01_14905 [Planctomycetota bacterium]|nr:MAG: hypothetical protein DWQ01_14905 [Planctomycetota bacterium]
MSSWLSIDKHLPWLRRYEPYFAHNSEEHLLRKGLKKIGFQITTIDGRHFNSEKDLLKSLGQALGFPSYFGINWDAYNECIFEVADSGIYKNIALIWKNADSLLERNLHEFVRAVHLLLARARALSALEDPFQMEIFFLGNSEAFRNPALNPFH